MRPALRSTPRPSTDPATASLEASRGSVPSRWDKRRAACVQSPSHRSVWSPPAVERAGTRRSLSVRFARTCSGRRSESSWPAWLAGSVIVFDQATKGAAVRAGVTYVVNEGAQGVWRGRLGQFAASSGSGAVLDLLGVLTLAGVLFIADRAAGGPRRVWLSLVAGGIGGNLCCRLGMHQLTAPHSVRGAIDWIPLNGTSWRINAADISLVIGLAASLATEATIYRRRQRFVWRTWLVAPQFSPTRDSTAHVEPLRPTSWAQLESAPRDSETMPRNHQTGPRPRDR